jgi:hypothetical protein
MTTMCNVSRGIDEADDDGVRPVFMRDVRSGRPGGRLAARGRTVIAPQTRTGLVP